MTLSPPAAASVSARWPGWPVALLRCAALTAAAGAVAVAFSIFSDVRSILFENSDLLLPVAYAHNLLTHPETILQFQLARLPSFVPDLASIVLLSAVIPSWRVVMLLYAVLSYASLVILGGYVAACLSGRAVWEGAAAFLALSAAALLADLALFQQTGIFTFIISPVIHSGSFVLALAGLCLGRRAAQRPTALSGALLLGFTLLGVLSDRVFAGSFAIPYCAATIGGALAARSGLAVRNALIAALAVVAGVVLGLLADRVLFSTVLTRESDAGLRLDWRHLADLLRDIRVDLSLAWAAVVVFTPVIWRRRDGEVLFWWTAGSVTVAGFLGLLPLIYGNHHSGRYMQPVWWWGLIVLTASLLRYRRRLPVLAGAATSVLAFAAMAATGRSSPALSNVLHVEDALASCIEPFVRSGVLHAGAAGFWTARATEAASNWKLQIEQVRSDGSAYLWGNNPLYYKVRKDDPTQAVLIDYVILDRKAGADWLNGPEIRGRFGAPNHVIECPENEVWAYSQPGGLGPAISGWR